MSVILAVSTCERAGGVSYLPETLASIDAQGGAELDRWLFCNGETAEAHLAPDGWRVSFGAPTQRRSSRVNFWRALEQACTVGSDLLFFEDDVHCCKNAVTRMASLVCPNDCAFMSFYDHAHPRQRREGGVWGIFRAPLPDDFHGMGYGGTQALLLPLRTCAYLAAIDPFSIRLDASERQCDKVLADFCAASPWPRFAQHAPSLVRHTGLVSAVRPGTAAPNWRHSPISYPGDWFDALMSDGPRVRRSIHDEP